MAADRTLPGGTNSCCMAEEAFFEREYDHYSRWFDISGFKPKWRHRSPARSASRSLLSGHATSLEMDTDFSGSAAGCAFDRRAGVLLCPAFLYSTDRQLL